MRAIPVIPPARPPLARTRNVIFDTVEYVQPINALLDLCCGSGSLGLEALSRGTEHVTFVDKDPKVIHNIRQTLKQWQIEIGENCSANVVMKDIMKVKFEDKKFDTAFMDLPFHDGNESLVLSNLEEVQCLQDGAMVMVRCHNKSTLDSVGKFKLLKLKTEGKSNLYFFKFEL